MAGLISLFLMAPGGANVGIEVSREGFSPSLESTGGLPSLITLGGDGIEASDLSRDELPTSLDGTDDTRAFSMIGSA